MLTERVIGHPGLKYLSTAGRESVGNCRGRTCEGTASAPCLEGVGIPLWSCRNTHTKSDKQVSSTKTIIKFLQIGATVDLIQHKFQLIASKLEGNY